MPSERSSVVLSVAVRLKNLHLRILPRLFNLLVVYQSGNRKFTNGMVRWDYRGGHRGRLLYCYSILIKRSESKNNCWIRWKEGVA